MLKKSTDEPTFWLPQKNAALSASAGSGKTYNLTWRLIAIMLYEQSLGNTLKNTFAVTFTNKATLDMKYKVLERLKKLAFPQYEKPDSADEEAIEYLSKFLTNGDKELLLKKASKVYSDLLNNLSDLNISTIHSFLSGIVALFPFEIGITPDNVIIDEVERDNILSESFDIFLQIASENKILEERILQAFHNLGYNSLDVKNIIYGLVREFFKREWEIKKRYSPDFLDKELSTVQENLDAIKFLFNEKKFKDCIEKIIEIIDKNEQFTTQNVTTFKKNLENLLGNTTLKRLLEFKKYFDKDSIEEVSGFKGFIKFLSNSPDNPAPRLEDSFQYVKSVFKSNITSFIEHTNKAIVLNFISLFLQYLEIYEKRKRQLKYLDFSDLEGLAYGLLGGTEFDRDYFYFRIDTRIKHLLIDEFQDTSIIQWNILEPLVDEIFSGIGVHNDKGSFFYVGDKKQAIYRFRRGESGLFDMVKSKLNITEYSLGKNFRSAKNIVDTVNIIFPKIMNKAEYVKQEVSVESKGYVEIDASVGDEDTAKRTVEIIKSLSDKGINLSEIAILVRDYKKTPLIENRLKKEKIAYRNEKTAHLEDAVEIKDLLNLLRFLNNPEDDISLSAVLKSPLFRIGSRTFERITSQEGKTLYLKLKNSKICEDTYEKLEDLLKKVLFLSPLRILNQIYIQFNIYSLYSRISGSEENLKKFFEEAYIFQKDNSADISSFLDYFNLKSNAILQAEPDDKGKGGVNIMTVHKAKGLEFHSVIIPFADFTINIHPMQTNFIFSYDNNFNLCDIFKTPTGDERALSGYLANCYESELEKVNTDEINLLYVALTRAKENLFVIGKKNSRENTWISKICSALAIDTGNSTDRCAPIYKIGEISPSDKKGKKKSGARDKTTEQDFEFSKYFTKSEDIEEDISPSSINEAEEIIINFSSREQINNKLEGKTIHCALSQIKLLSDEDDIEAIVSGACSFAERNMSDTSQEDGLYIERLISHIREKIFEVLSDKSIKSIFFKSDSRQVRVEVPIYYKKTAKKNVYGIIDRLIIDENVVKVIDYKWIKNVNDDRDINKAIKRYRPQLEYYSLSMSKLYPHKNIKSYLLLINAPEGKRLVEI